MSVSRQPVRHTDDWARAWLSGDTAEGGCLLLDPEAGLSLGDLSAPGNGTILLLVGPEGGYSAGETTLAVTSGFSAVRLGPRVLRTETAALAMIAALQALWGDMR